MLTKERRGNISTEIWFQKYRILGQLGKGGTGSVFLAEHIRLGYFRAIKRVNKCHPAYRQLMQEADILKSLKHPCIPVIYDVEEDAAYSYLVMEYIKGLSLKDLFLRQGHIKEEGVVLICLQICEVFLLLHSAEQSILYLDLKPDNIIVEESKITLVDFGSATKTNNRKERLSMGTKGFAAPEQYDLGCTDRRSDVYGLGNLMLFMATGLSNPAGLHCLEESKDYSGSFKQTVFQCLKYNKAERFETIDQVREKLLALRPGKRVEKAPSPGTSITVAFAGVQPRCGVTHICLLLTEYLCRRGWRAVYVEAGRKKDIFMLCQKENGRPYPVLCGEPKRLREKYRDYEVFICDYGAYQEAGEGFWQEDRICLVTGARAWELAYWEEAEKEVLQRGFYEKEENKGRFCFLVNLIGAKEFFRQVKERKTGCLRMPYRDSVSEEDRELSRILEMLLKRSLYERDICYRKGKTKEDKEASKDSLSDWRGTWRRSYPYRYFTGRIFRRKKRGPDAVSGGQQP